MQRILSETTTVQRLLTQVLLTPVVDAIVLVIVISYLLAFELANDCGCCSCSLL